MKTVPHVRNCTQIIFFVTQQQPRMLEGCLFALTKTALISGTWPMTGQILLRIAIFPR
jgi:hypothetical protein